MRVAWAQAAACPLLLIACTGSPEAGDPPGGRPTTGDTGARDPAETLTGPCPAWSGLTEVGATRTYTRPGSGQADEGEWTSSFVRLDPPWVEWRVEGHFTEDWSTYQREDTRAVGTCDASGWWLEEVHERLTEYTKSDTEIQSVVTLYDPPVLLVPTGLTVGSAWTSRYQGVRTVDEGSPTTVDATVDQTVVARESLTVAAGTWAAFRVDVRADDGAVSTRWLGRDVGLLLDPERELAQVSE